MQLQNLGNFSNAINEYIKMGTLAGNVEKTLSDSLKGLTTSQILAKVSTHKLTDELKLQLITEYASDAETYQTVTALNALSASETAATGTTAGLSAAFQGLASSLGISTAALGALIAGAAVISAAAVAYRQYKQHLEAVRQETAQAADVYKDSSSSVEEYASRYQSLHSALLAAKGDEEKTCQIKKQLLELQTELNDKFGDAYGTINLVTDAYKDQTDAIRAYNREAAQTFLNENAGGIEDAAEAMTRERHYNLSYTGVSSATGKGKALMEVAEKYAGQGVTALDESGDGSTFSLHLKSDAQSAYDTINAFASDLRAKAKELGDEHMFDDVLEISSSELNRAKSVIDDYGEIFTRSLIAEIASDDEKATVYNEALKAVEAYNNAVLNSKDPFSDKTVENAREKLAEIKDLINSDSGWDKYAPVTDSVFEQADTGLLDFNDRMQADTGMKKLAQDLDGMDRTDLSSLNPGENASFDRLKESAEDYGLQINDVIDTLVRLGYIQDEVQDAASTSKDWSPSIFHDDIIEDLEKQVKPVMSAIQNAWQDAYNSDGSFAVDPTKALDAVSSIKNAIDSINGNEALGIKIDTSSLENLSRVLTDTESGESKVEAAYSRIVDAVMNEFLPAMQGMDGSQFPIMQSFLESMGILNAEELMIQSLGYSYETYTAAKEAAANTGASLNADINETASLLETEGLMASDDAQQIMDYMLAKYAASGGSISVDDTIFQLAKEYGWLADLIDQWGLYYNTSKKGYGNTSGSKNLGIGNYTPVTATDTKRNAKVKSPKDSDIPSAGSRGSSAKSARTETDALSNLNSEMDKLQSSYKSLCDIRDTYNQNGKITVDQYQELTNMGFTFLSQLVDENGQLGLNASAFERLSQAKLQEMQIQMAKNAADTINGLKTEAAAVEYLTYANEQLRDAALGAAEAQLEAAVANANAQGGKRAEAAQQIYQGYQASKQMASKVDFSFTPSSSVSSPAAAAEPADTKSSANPTDAYNKEKSLLEHMLAMDQISKSEYYERLMSLVKQYFEGDPEHQDQIWDVEESYHDYLESIKETYNWIEIFLDNLAKKANALIDKASKFITWSKKNAMINRAVKATDKQITGQTNAYAYYAEKARKVGLNNAYIDKIQNGTLTMEDMYNEGLSGKIEKYQEWYDKMVACSDAINELYDQERDLIKQKLDNVLDYYNDLDSYMSSIVSKMDSFISVMDDMGKRSSLTDLLEQFAAANEQIAHFQSQTTTTQKENEKNYFDSSKKVAAARKKDQEELIGSLTSEKEQAVTGVQNTGTYKKLLQDIAKAELAVEKQQATLNKIDPNRDKNGKQKEAAQKNLDQLQGKVDDLIAKRDDIAANVSANDVAEYSKLYDQQKKLLDKQETLRAKLLKDIKTAQLNVDKQKDILNKIDPNKDKTGKQKEAALKKLDQLTGKLNELQNKYDSGILLLSKNEITNLEKIQYQMLNIAGSRDNAIKSLEHELGLAKGEIHQKTDSQKIMYQINAVDKELKSSATYQKLMQDIAAQEEKIYKEQHKYDGKKVSNGQLAAQQKNLDKMNAQLDAYNEKKLQLEQNATADTVGEYAKVYDAWRKLQDKLDAGKVLSVAEYKNYNKYNDQLKQFAEERSSILKDLNIQLEKVFNPSDDLDLNYSDIYKKLLKNIENTEKKIDRFSEKNDGKYDKEIERLNSKLAEYYDLWHELGENATVGTIDEYYELYKNKLKLEETISKLQYKMQQHGNLKPIDEAHLEKTIEKLEAVNNRLDELVQKKAEVEEQAKNPIGKIDIINREYEEAAEGIDKSYHDQIDNIDAKMKASRQYQDLLAKKQNLENIRDTSGLNASQEKTLRKYTEELEALEKGGTGDNIANYMKTWEQWYALQQKINDGKKLSTADAAKYDSLKSQLDAWNKEKQTQISDLIDLMNDDLEKLRETNAENIAEAEQEINSYYSKVYELAKQIAEYNINTLQEQLAYLDAYISYYKDLVSLYDQFSGDKLSRLLTDLDEGAFSDQLQVYEKYLVTLQSKYDATLSEINEYKQLIDAIDTNDFQASMDLFQKAMDNYKAAGNTEMADRLQSVLDLLNERAVDADNWDEYADLWLNEWEQALAEAKSGLIETAGSIQEINDALREVRFSNVTDALEELTRAGNVLSSMSNLIQDTWLYEGDGLSEYGKAKVALLVSQLENAQGAANEYLELVKKIQDNEDTYASDQAYQDALAEATQNYYDSLSNAADIENTIVDIMKKAQEEEVSNWKDIIAARKEALSAKKSYYDFDRTIKDKNKNIEALKAELAAINEVNTAEAKARKAKLEAQLKEAEDDLADTKIEHEYDLQVKALDDWADKLEDALDDSTNTVQESLESQKKIIEEAKELYRTSTDSVNKTMDKIVNFYSGMGMSIDGIETAKNESSGIRSALEQPEFKDKLVSMMSDRIVPDLGGVLDTVNRTENYQMNTSDNRPVEINTYYDSLLRVDGNVDKNTLPELKVLLEESYQYTSKQLYSELKRVGYSKY